MVLITELLRKSIVKCQEEAGEIKDRRNKRQSLNRSLTDNQDENEASSSQESVANVNKDENRSSDCKKKSKQNSLNSQEETKTKKRKMTPVKKGEKCHNYHKKDCD